MLFTAYLKMSRGNLFYAKFGLWTEDELKSHIRSIKTNLTLL